MSEKNNQTDLLEKTQIHEEEKSEISETKEVVQE